MKLAIAFAVDSVEFTAGVVSGAESLGGSESACLGLARALQARGHDVHIFTTKLGADAPAVDHGGVTWHPQSRMTALSVVKDWDVLVALRQPVTLAAPHIQAKFRILWNQDLMSGDGMKNHIMACAWGYDAVAYVSAYHRKQWEVWVPELAPVGWVTKNGYDPALVPEGVTRNPNQIIHISRPERGLKPLLLMWPELRKLRPQAELKVARYNSMYDATGWGQVCRDADTMTEVVNAEVGGITLMGELGKPALYKALAESAVMWYPGVWDFAETSCIASIEAQANGCPFVGSFKGALPETVPSGVLVPGDAMDPEYQQASIAAVVEMLDGAARDTFAYRKRQRDGRAHVKAYAYDVLAAEWEAWLLASFRTRYETRKVEVMAAALHYDDHEIARRIAAELGDDATQALADRVAAGLEHQVDDYARHAMDPVTELHWARNNPDGRVGHVLQAVAGKERVLDLACGTGVFALAMAMETKTRTVVGVDFSAENIRKATELAATLGLSDRVTFYAADVWDMATQTPPAAALPVDGQTFDAVWVGEFLEHVREAPAFINFVESFCADGGTVVFSVPMGPMMELAERRLPYKRSHVHHFRPVDLVGVFQEKQDLSIRPLVTLHPTGLGNICGNWVVSYTHDPTRQTRERPYERRILLRPRPRLSVGIIANQAMDIRKCLESIWLLADEIVVGNTGDENARVALEEALAEFPRKCRLVDVGSVQQLDGGFSEARNRVMAETTGEWFLWIDTDEVLTDVQEVRKYIDLGGVYRGYVIRQHHLSLDQPPNYDRPTRLFRKGPDIQFYGCVHEQPQQNDCNGPIYPCMEVVDTGIAHTGYLTESVRRDKCLNRNLPLLKKDREKFPNRELGLVLVMRDYTNFALWDREQARGRITEKSKHYRSMAIGIFEKHFADPKHPLHPIAKPFYDTCVSNVTGAIEVECGFAAKLHGMGQSHMTPGRFWARTPEQAKDWFAHQVDQALKTVTPVVLDVEPIVGRPVDQAAPAPTREEVPA